MVIWPFVVALVWCCGMVPWQRHCLAKSRELNERYAPLPPPPKLRAPTRSDFAVMALFGLYHLPVFLPVTWLSMALKTNEQYLHLELLVTIFLTAVLYSALFTWVL